LYSRYEEIKNGLPIFPKIPVSMMKYRKEKNIKMLETLTLSDSSNEQRYMEE
jgi:hypothetical protein